MYLQTTKRLPRKLKKKLLKTSGIITVMKNIYFSDEELKEIANFHSENSCKIFTKSGDVSFTKIN